MKRRILSVVVYIIIIGISCGCTAPAQAVDTTVFAMDTVMNLRLYGDDGAAADALTDVLQRLDRTLSVTDPHSALYALNETGASDEQTLLALFAQAQALYLRTKGAVDPSVYPVVRLWGFTAEDYRVPASDELDAALALTGLDRIYAQDGTLRLEAGAALDFGAFAKGYAGDLCRALLEQRGLSGILSLGGSIQTVGSKPDGTDWTVGVANPDRPEDYLLTLRVRGSKAVVTSGDYQRFFEQDGRRYCHIIDPATGYPVENGLRSVTVVCDSGLTADGLSTALFVMGMEGAVALWRASEDFELVLIASDGAVFVTEGLQQTASGQFTVIGRTP